MFLVGDYDTSAPTEEVQEHWRYLLSFTLSAGTHRWRQRCLHAKDFSPGFQTGSPDSYKTARHREKQRLLKLLGKAQCGS